jgi:hypothetical protein
MDWPSAGQLPNPPSFMDKVGLGIGIVGMILIGVGLSAAATVLSAPAIAAIGVALVIVGIITAMFGWSGCEPVCPSPDSPAPVLMNPAQGAFAAPPDGGGVDGTSDDGGGGAGSDQSVWA